MSEHTPGPWRAIAGNRSWKVWAPNTTGSGASLAECWAHCDHRGRELYAQEANARLIAAAPALLEAARDAAQHYQSLEEGFIADGLEEVARDCAETRRALQRAIARAVGRE